MFRHLLVPLDGSRLAEAALSPALEVASKFDSDITLVRVVQPVFTAISPESVGYVSLLTDHPYGTGQEAENYLKEQQAQLQAQGYHVNVRVMEKDPVADGILEVAGQVAADAIIMSTHGRAGISRWVHGSVADKIVCNANIPVILIRAVERAADAPVKTKAERLLRPEEESADVLERMRRSDQHPRPLDRLVDEQMVDSSSR